MNCMSLIKKCAIISSNMERSKLGSGLRAVRWFR